MVIFFMESKLLGLEVQTLTYYGGSKGGNRKSIGLEV